MSVYITDPRDSLRKSIERIFQQYKECIDPAKPFFLKPNIVFPVAPNSGEITRPKLVEILINTIRSLYPESAINIGEGTAAGTIPEENFRVSGFRDLASGMDVPLLDLDEVERVEVPWKFGTLSLPKMALESNYINLPILKLSSAAIFSGAMKNQKGLLTPAMKKKFHRLGLHEPIAELTRTVQPTLTIMDGYNFFQKNLLLAGSNVCDIDQTSVSLLNIQEPEYIRLACESGLGSGQNAIIGYGRIKPLGKRKVHPAYKKFLRIRLWSNPRACSMCRLSFQRMGKIKMENLGQLVRMYAKIANQAIKGTDIVFGGNPEFDPAARRIICVGNCTEKVAMENGYVHVPGCPPSEEEILKKF